MTQKEYNKARRELKDQYYMGMLRLFNYVHLRLQLWRQYHSISAVGFWFLILVIAYIMAQIIRAII